MQRIIVPIIIALALLFQTISYGEQSANIGDTHSPELTPPPAFTPLTPPATHNPRETLFGFLEKMNTAAAIIYQIEQESRQENSLFHSEKNIKQAEYAEELLEQAIRTFDLSEISEVDRKHIGLENALMLKDILDRISMPEAKDVPVSTTVSGKTLDRWEIPGTEIVIARGTKDPYIDEYLFSPNTVKRIPEFFFEVHKMKPLDKSLKYYDFYDFYTSTPGSILPPKWSLWLPDWSKDELYYDQTIWQWIALTLTLLIVTKLCIFLVRWKTTTTDHTYAFLNILLSLIICGILWGSDYFIKHILNITSAVFQIVSFVLTALLFIALSWTSYISINWLAQEAFKPEKLNKHSIDFSVIRTILRLISIVAAATILYFGAQFLGIPIAPLLTGFGALGLAVGIGAQEYFKNVVGGMTLFIDRPIRIGEWCRFNKIVGEIEDIGLRSTKIRTMDRKLMIIPNSTFSTANITNYSRISERRLQTVIALRYDTGRSQLLNILENIREYLEVSPTVKESFVRLSSLGEYSLNITVRADILTVERMLFLEFQEIFLLKIIEIVEAEGADFAFPSQTLYLEQTGEEQSLDKNPAQHTV